MERTDTDKLVVSLESARAAAKSAAQVAEAALARLVKYQRVIDAAKLLLAVKESMVGALGELRQAVAELEDPS